MDFSFWLNNKEYKLNLKEKNKDQVQVILDEKEYTVSAEFLKPNFLLLNINGRVFETIISSNASSYAVYVNGKRFEVKKKTEAQILAKKAGKSKRREVKTSMPGKIVKVFLREGQEVKKGQAVLILQAMKMQNEVKSPQAGKLVKVGPKAGDSIEAGALLFTVE